MYQQNGSIDIFRASRTGLNLFALAWVSLVGSSSLVGVFQFLKSGFGQEKQMIIVIVASGFFIVIAILIFWTYIIPAARKSIVLQMGPEGVNSDFRAYRFHGISIHWEDLLDFKVFAITRTGRVAVNIYRGADVDGNLIITLILKKDSPSWLAMPRKWIFWRSNSIDIPLIPLPVTEQIQAALALRTAFAHYGGGGEAAARFKQEDQMKAEAFEELGRFLQSSRLDLARGSKQNPDPNP